MSLRLAAFPYLDGDIALFVPRPDMLQEMHAGWDWSEGPPPGRTWTLKRPGGPVVGVGGLYEDRPGHFQAWAILSPLERRDWPEAVKLARQVLEGAFRFMGARRIDASARAGNPAAAAVLRKLGFKFVAIGIDRRFPEAGPYVFMQRAADPPFAKASEG